MWLAADQYDLISGQSPKSLSTRYIMFSHVVTKTVFLIGLTYQDFNLANNTSKTMFEFFEKNSIRINRFKNAISFLQTFSELQNFYVLENFDWTSLENSLVVDVGDFYSLISMDIVREFLVFCFVVQNLPQIIEDAKIKISTELADRIIFITYNIFIEQSIKDANVYYFR